MGFKIENKVAIVTGGSSGIGFETVKLLLKQGAKVAWCGRSETRLQESYDQLSTCFNEENMLIMSADVLDKDSVQSFINATVARFGGIDMLINNAGQGKVADFNSTEDSDWLSEVSLKYFGVLNPIKAALPFYKNHQ